MKSELIENRLIVWDLSDSKKLFTNGYYGKPIGISKPKSNDIDAPLILDLIEGYYLMLKSKIQIFKNKKRVTTNGMLEICREQHHNFDKKFLVYNDFREKYHIEIKNVYGDATVLKTIIRSNPGFFLLRNGTVTGKWHYNKFPDAKEILRRVNISI